MSHGSRENKIAGCLLGGAIGDALGAPVEFWTLEKIRSQCGDTGVRKFLPARYGNAHGTGLITDDTQMTLFTVEGLIRAVIRIRCRGVGNVQGPVHHAYQRWYTTQVFPTPPETDDQNDPAFMDGWLGKQQWLYSPRAPGNTCMAALKASRGESFGAVASNDSKGCGTVMRSAPFGLVSADHPGDLAVHCSEITHGHPAASASAGALAVLIHEIVNGADLHHAVKAARTWVQEWTSKYRAGQEVSEVLERAIGAAKNGDPSPNVVASLGEGWVAEEALAIAVYCALVFPRSDQVLDALSLAVTHSGDSDSTGAICGNILGALHGECALPEELVANVEGAATIRLLANDLATLVDEPEKVFTGRAGPDSVADREWWNKYPGW